MFAKRSCSGSPIRVGGGYRRLGVDDALRTIPVRPFRRPSRDERPRSEPGDRRRSSAATGAPGAGFKASLSGFVAHVPRNDLGLSPFVYPQGGAGSMVKHREIVLSQPGGRDLRLDLYEPECEANAVIVMVHGGGWRGGSREGIAAYGHVLARRGFLAVAGEYRLLDEAQWPAQLEDVQAATLWAFEHARHKGLPPGRVTLLGFSAGGHLALLAADELKDRVAAVVALFPPVELVSDAPDRAQTAASKLLGANASAEAARSASPLHRVGPNFPPTFLIHGAEDPVIPHLTSQRMFDALIDAGVKAELHIYAGHTHEFADAPYMMELVAAEVSNFLERMVVDPDGARQQDLAHNSFARRPG